MTLRTLSRTALSATALLALAACAGAPVAPRPEGVPAPPTDPAGVRRALLGRNEGLGEVRAVVEARISVSGRAASFPGVLVLRGRGAFRLDLLDPLDRPLAIVFTQGGRLVQYRPGEQYAASLGAFPEGCRELDPGEWAGAVVSDLPEPAAGDRARLWSFWGRRTLEIERHGVLRQSLAYAEEGGELRPSKISWYCGEDPVMQLRIRSWLPGGRWRIPGRFEVSWPRANVAVSVQVREALPGRGDGAPVPLAPRLGPETRWTVWNLPQ